ncbi:MAG: NusG domain II-containing protein, partial [Spirochaetaceae bacterium]|nr:NusG domain II-containing protein [Spirochaetaceae bacterium]
MKVISLVKPLDLAALGLALGFILFASLRVYAPKGEARRFLITGAGERWLFPQDAKELIAVPGPLGETVVQVEDGKARILASPCKNQTCVAAGAVHGRGQWVACLPNQ